jgi:hypothetical protein
VYEGTVAGSVAYHPPTGQRGGVVLVEPGYDGRVEWVSPGRRSKRPAEAAALQPGTVVANNLKALARVHRARIEGGEPTPPRIPGVDDLDTGGIIASL